MPFQKIWILAQKSTFSTTTMVGLDLSHRWLYTSVMFCNVLVFLAPVLLILLIFLLFTIICFPKLSKKFFWKKLKKCKCYKRSSSDHQQQHHYHPTTKAKSRILLNCIWAYFKMYLCIWAICICVFVYNKITSYSWWWWWWQIWDWWQWGR